MIFFSLNPAGINGSLNPPSAFHFVFHSLSHRWWPYSSSPAISSLSARSSASPPWLPWSASATPVCSSFEGCNEDLRLKSQLASFQRRSPHGLLPHLYGCLGLACDESAKAIPSSMRGCGGPIRSFASSPTFANHCTNGLCCWWMDLWDFWNCEFVDLWICATTS